MKKLYYCRPCKQPGTYQETFFLQQKHSFTCSSGHSHSHCDSACKLKYSHTGRHPPTRCINSPEQTWNSSFFSCLKAHNATPFFTSHYNSIVNKKKQCLPMWKTLDMTYGILKVLFLPSCLCLNVWLALYIYDNVIPAMSIYGGNFGKQKLEWTKVDLIYNSLLMLFVLKNSTQSIYHVLPKCSDGKWPLDGAISSLNIFNLHIV